MADNRLLSPKDLKGVNKFLYAARAVWEKLGKILDPSGELVQDIDGRDNAECMYNMLKKWLERTDLDHSWKFLVAALEEVNESWVAYTIEEKYANNPQRTGSMDTDDDSLDISESTDQPPCTVEVASVSSWPLCTEEMALLNPHEFQKGKEIGRGAGGVVFEGTWQKLPVALKKLANVGPNNELELRREVGILSELRHPNIISYHGTVVLDHGYYVVTELAEKGSLYGCLQKSDPDLPQGFRWAKDIAEGVRYLHKNRYIHRDLKSGNVLLMKDDSAKICDFGSAKQTQNASTIQTNLTGTHQWRSPEAIRGEKVSFSWDAYSYGILLWELLTHRVPFSHLKLRVPGQEYQLQEAILGGERPKPVPEGSDHKLEKLSSLMQRCWKEIPEERPTFTQIIAELEEVPRSPVSPRNRPSVSDSVGNLTMQDFRSVFKALRPISHRWLELGLVLGVEYAELRSMDRSIGRKDTLERLGDLVEAWLTQSDNATWSTLVQTLVDMGEQRLALDIEIRHYTHQ